MLTKNDLTAIGNLFDKKFDEKFDRKLDQKLTPINDQLKYMNSKIVGVYGEIDGLKKQLGDFQEETQQNFNTVFNGLTNLGETIDKNLEPRIKHLENKVFSQSFPLAK